jgi:hypothetical protein
MKRMNLVMLGLVAIILVASCRKDDKVTPSTTTVASKTILVNGATTGNFFLYSFENGQIANSDSATNKWDFGVRFEKIIVNSNFSGPGTATVQIVDGTFDAYATAPDNGYLADSSATNLAVKGSQWYNYDAATRTFAPKAGKLFIFKTNAGRYAKMEILTADPADDNGNAVVPPTRPTKIKYTLRQAVQMNGTKSF